MKKFTEEFQCTSGEFRKMGISFEFCKIYQIPVFGTHQNFRENIRLMVMYAYGNLDDYERDPPFFHHLCEIENENVNAIIGESDCRISELGITRLLQFQI